MTAQHPVTLTTAFDASNLWSHDWWFAAFGLLFVCAGIMMALRPEFFGRRRATAPGTKVTAGFGWLFAAGAALWTAGNFYLTYSEWQKTTDELRPGRFDIAEGFITDFQRVPFWGKGWEGFTVGGHRFWYSSYIITPGFHQYASFGGPIREGEYARVSYRKNLILKLEIAKVAGNNDRAQE